MERKGEILVGNFTVVVVDFNIPSSISGACRKGREGLSNTVNSFNLIGIYRTLYLTTAEYTLVSSSHRTFSKKDQILSHRTSLN